MRLAVCFSTYHGGRGRLEAARRSDVARIALLRAVIVCEGVGFMRQRDWLYVGVTATVLALLAYSLLASS